MTPYYQDATTEIYLADCRDVLLGLDRVDVAIVDPPYGETSLQWDVPVTDWTHALPCDSFWCFGSFRSLRVEAFKGWKFAQDIVWEKHNGSNSSADRFRRVHEMVVQFYRGPWGALYAQPPTTNDATARVVRRKKRPPQWGDIGAAVYTSEDGGPRLMRSVIKVRSEHGRALHETQKPIGILTPLIEFSCPRGGTVLDPFAGSGSSLVAAKLSGRKAIGIEIEERYCEIAAQRLAQEVLAL